MHAEQYEISEETAGGSWLPAPRKEQWLRLETTVVRALEDSAQHAQKERTGKLLVAGKSEARIFISPGYKFLAVDALLTNFHLPRSTLLALVCSFAGREQVLAAYRHAVDAEYRFYSYGDCMLIR